MLCVAKAISALMHSTVMTPDIWLRQHLDCILSNGDTLYQKLENVCPTIDLKCLKNNQQLVT